MIKRKRWYRPRQQDIREALAICVDSTYWVLEAAIDKELRGSYRYKKGDKTFNESLCAVFQTLELVLQTQMIALSTKHPEYEGRIKSLHINLHHLFLSMVLEIIYQYKNRRPFDLKNPSQELTVPALLLVEVLKTNSFQLDQFIQTKLRTKYQWI